MTAKRVRLMPMTPADKALVSGILQATWQEIGADIIQAGGGTDLPCDHVVEAVLDADYAARHARSPEQKAAWARYEALGYQGMCKVARETFRAARYGQ